MGIVIIPNTNPNVNLNHIRNVCDTVAVMQEGPHWYFQDYTIDKQFHYYNTLMSADWVYCHNESDVNYYKGLGCTDVRVMRSLMIPEGLVPRSEWGNGTIIGGNFVSWYGGFDSYMVAREIGKPITSPSMGRKQDQESMIEDITYLPYMSWREWIKECGKYKVGIHMMRTHAAGTFSLNLAYHGTPCIGYEGLDTQDLLHPQPTVEVGNIAKAQSILKKLYSDKFFYHECSEQTKELFDKHYSEEAWLDEDWQFHLRFFNGLKEHLNPGGRCLLIESSLGSHISIFEPMVPEGMVATEIKIPTDINPSWLLEVKYEATI